MFSLLLAIIYIAFISLGLPDSLLGSAWPVMHIELGQPLSAAGFVTVIISGGTVVSSLLSERLTRKMGTGAVTAVSVLMTAAALLGFSVSSKLWHLCLFALPYGLGAGGVDAALNNYVALHYKSRHMSWLHCFWGVGAAISPNIMARALTSGAGWSGGYRAVGLIQLALTAILFLSLPLWKKRSSVSEDGKPAPHLNTPVTLKQALSIRGVKLVIITFFCYCAIEVTAGLWASSYLAGYRGASEETAARFASLFYIGITVGRFLSGFFAERMGDKLLVRVGTALAISGIALIALPSASAAPAVAGLLLLGLGCAPIYPAIIHSTPANFGRENSQSIIGIQMASAYLGTILMPPLFGIAADVISVGLYPAYLFALALVMLAMSERANKVLGGKA